jgi:CRISPR-associated endoribonuclease Cas6
MPESICLLLNPTRGANLPSFQGGAAHAILLEMMARADPSLSKRLHDSEGVKGFTVSSLFGLNPSAGALQVKENREYCLRFTAYGQDVSRALGESLDSGLPASLRLEALEFTVRGVARTPEEHPWAGSATYEDMFTRRLFGEVPSYKVQLEFASPTTFRSKGVNVALPLPGLVFGSLLDCWNASAPTELSPDFRRYAEEMIVASKYDLRTQLVPVAGARQLGFTGTCEFTATNRDAYWLRIMNLLVDFAFYSGAGYKTAMGLGQCRRIGPPERSSPMLA